MRICQRRMMDGELQHDQAADTAENQWKRETFNYNLDTILNSFKDCFENKRARYKSLSWLAQSKFKELHGRHKSSHDLKPHVRSFCSSGTSIQTDVPMNFTALPKISKSLFDLVANQQGMMRTLRVVRNRVMPNMKSMQKKDVTMNIMQLQQTPVKDLHPL